MNAKETSFPTESAVLLFVKKRGKIDVVSVVGSFKDDKVLPTEKDFNIRDYEELILCHLKNSKFFPEGFTTEKDKDFNSYSVKDIDGVRIGEYYLKHVPMHKLWYL